MNFHKFVLISLCAIAIANTNQIFSQTCKVKTGTLHNGCKVFTEVFEYDFVDVKPEFPGGSNEMINFINKNRKYPENAYDTGIEGRVTCAFIVYPDGKVKNITVLRGVEASLNDEAVRIITAMPDWKPGKIGNQNVPVRVICCIPFRK